MSNIYTLDDLTKMGVRVYGKNIHISKFVNIYNPKNLILHDNIRIDDFTVISCKGIIEIFNYVHISAQCFISSTTKIVIGNFTAISVGTKIFGGCDDFSGKCLANPTIPSKYTNVKTGDILIGDNVIIGSNSVIMPDITICDGVAVGANSFINKNCEPWKIYAGSPIRHIKNRNNDCIQLLDEFTVVHKGMTPDYSQGVNTEVKPQMICWVPKKNIDVNNIQLKINECVEKKHLTNNGKNVKELQKTIKDIFKIDDDKEILLTCNGAMGINALIGGLNIFYNKKLKWAVQSFTFPCSKQGLLTESIVFDLDENMGPSMVDLNNRKDEYDGILVTNCFGCSTNIEVYENFCKENNKLLLFDNAASSFTFHKNKNHLNYGIGCMVSLHHTKPIGFGEGGFIIFDCKFLEAMEKSICFGFTQNDRHNYDIYASNYKMSEIACIYIADYLKNLNNIFIHHTKLICYFIERLQTNNLNQKVKMFSNFSSFDNCLMATIPILFEREIKCDYFVENNIEAKKYYYPLDLNCDYSNDLFKKIVCLPLNTDMTLETIDLYIDVITSIVI